MKSNVELAREYFESYCRDVFPTAKYTRIATFCGIVCDQMELDDGGCLTKMAYTQSLIGQNHMATMLICHSSEMLDHDGDHIVGTFISRADPSTSQIFFVKHDKDRNPVGEIQSISKYQAVNRVLEVKGLNVSGASAKPYVQ